MEQRGSVYHCLGFYMIPEIMYSCGYVFDFYFLNVSEHLSLNLFNWVWYKSMSKLTGGRDENTDNFRLSQTKF